VASRAAAITIREAIEVIIGSRRLHVAERVDDQGRRIDPLKLHLIDANAGAIVVEHIVHQLLHGLLSLLARARKDRRDIALADLDLWPLTLQAARPLYFNSRSKLQTCIPCCLLPATIRMVANYYLRKT
jgi:hypothetical protein